MTHSRSIKRREFLRKTGLMAACLCFGRRADADGSKALLLRKIEPAAVGIRATGSDFDFVIFADPQGGDPSDATNDSPERVAIHNPYIERNIEAVNQLQPAPAFLVIAGDIVDSKGQQSNFDAMLGFLKALRIPILFELGNHETRYSARITPSDMSELENYFRAQRQINGLDTLLYSFDLGRWHFVIWPDPLRSGFWEAHPHFFDWLDEDLRTHRDRPTIFIQHVPPLPIGIDPMIAYTESVPVKRRLLEILTRYGNVKYAISGHVHIPLKASLKIAGTYKGTKFINLPAAGYRARGFGEPDFGQGPSQGFALVKVRGEEATIEFRRIDGETFTYPRNFPEFDPDEWPLWLNEPWQLPASPQVVNGGFERGLEGWSRRFVYEEDENPSSVCRATDETARSGSKSLYLFTRERGYHVRGQDRMPQTINRICQAVSLRRGDRPLVHLAYRLDGRYFDRERACGAYLWLEGWCGCDARLHMVYWAGMAIAHPAGLYGRRPPFLHWEITSPPDRWHDVTINLGRDYERGAKGPPFDKLDLDRLVITLGVWTENVGKDQAIGIYFDDVRIGPARDVTAPSRVEGQEIDAKRRDEIWNKRIAHIDGEHVFVER